LLAKEPWYAWESVNLISDCNDGKIYAVMMGTIDNKSFLYRVFGTEGSAGTHLYLEYVTAVG